MAVKTEEVESRQAPDLFSAEVRRMMARMSEADLRALLQRVLEDRDRQAEARMAAEQERDEVRARMQAFEEAALKAGAIGIVRERRDDRLIATIGRNAAVLGIPDPKVDYHVGDMIQTDVGRVIVVENLGGGEGCAADLAQLVSLLENDRAMIRSSGKDRVYRLAHHLRNGKRESLKPGALVLVDEDSCIVYDVYSSPESDNYAEEIPELVYVSNPVFEKAEHFIGNLLLGGPEKRQPGTCLIFVGPAGGGKSHLLKVVCRRTGIKYIRITHETVASGIVSETGHAIKSIFSRAIEEAKTGKPVLIVIEEANTLASKRYGYDHRSAASQEFGNITSCMITCIDSLIDLGPEPPIAVALTTNAISELEPAMRSRGKEYRIGFIDRDFGGRVLRAHLESSGVDLAGGDADVERLTDLIFDRATPMVQVEAEIGQTRERFKLYPGQLVLPRLISHIVGDLKISGSPVSWEDAARAAHSKLLSHAEQVADSPDHYVIYADHPFAGDPELRIRRAISVYPAEPPSDFLLQ